MESARLAAQKARTLLEEFKNFAFKGNVVDLAVGVIIGAAFGKIVTALVERVMMPLISFLVPSDKPYTQWKWESESGGKAVEYGAFLGEVVNFVIVALILYIFIVKFLGWLISSQKAPPPPTKDQELLMEIRDLLKKNVA
jgi:large conductance mechanosensitive channel